MGKHSEDCERPNEAARNKNNKTEKGEISLELSKLEKSGTQRM